MALETPGCSPRSHTEPHQDSGAEPGELALTVTLEKAAHTRTPLILLSYNPTVCAKWFTHQGSFVLQCCAACAGSQINSKVWPSSA